MAPFMSATASEQQKAAEASLVIRLKAEKRQSLERRLTKGRSKEEEMTLIESLDTNIRERLEGRLRGGRSKNQTFLSVMYFWYQHLDPKQKQRLTPKQLKRQALAVCREYFIVYNKLPLNWVTEMMEKLGMKLYQYKKTEKHHCNKKIKTAANCKAPQVTVPQATQSLKMPATS